MHSRRLSINVILLAGALFIHPAVAQCSAACQVCSRVVVALKRLPLPMQWHQCRLLLRSRQSLQSLQSR